MRLIREVGGWYASFGTWVVLIASFALPFIELTAFGTGYGFAIAVSFMAVGWLFKNQIVELGAEYGRRSNQVLIVYALVFYLAKRLDATHHAQLLIILVATVIMFNLNFWSISEAAIIDKNLCAAEE